METIGSKRSYALIWCMPNNDDDDVADRIVYSMIDFGIHKAACLIVEET